MFPTRQTTGGVKRTGAVRELEEGVELLVWPALSSGKAVLSARLTFDMENQAALDGRRGACGRGKNK